MEIITCEMCGAHEFTENEGYLICDYCGTRYTSFKKQNDKTYDEAPTYYNDYEEISFDGIPSSLWETFGLTLAGKGMQKKIKKWGWKYEI